MHSSETENILNDCVDDFSALNITENNGLYEQSLSVDPDLFGLVIGKNKSIQNEIEANTQTIIKIVQSDPKIIVRGHSSGSVDKAVKEVCSRLDTVNTHFLSIPIKDEAIHERFSLFKERILNGNEQSRINDVAFRKQHKLHIAFSTMRLEREEKIKRFIDKLNEFKRENQSLFKPFKIHFKDIGRWEKDEAAVKRIIAKPVKDMDFERLSEFGRKINDYLFKEKIIPINKDYKMNFHLMLINSAYLKYDFPEIKDFDITHLSDELKKWDFGISEISEFCLSQRRTGDDSNYYKNDATWYLDEL